MQSASCKWTHCFVAGGTTRVKHALVFPALSSPTSSSRRLLRDSTFRTNRDRLEPIGAEAVTTCHREQTKYESVQGDEGISLHGGTCSLQQTGLTGTGGVRAQTGVHFDTQHKKGKLNLRTQMHFKMNHGRRSMRSCAHSAVQLADRGHNVPAPDAPVACVSYTYHPCWLCGWGGHGVCHVQGWVL